MERSEAATAAAGDAAQVVATSLCKRFRDPQRREVRAVDEVTFTARPGEVFGLLGANGAGKTTTLRMLATMLAPSAGDALVCGRSITREPAEVRRRIGFLSTSTALYGRLTAREVIAYFGRLHELGEQAIAARTKELMARFDMEKFADVRCDRLSSGMKQKVSIVRTVLHDPPVMILDEPTAGLDVLTSRTIVDFIRDSRGRGKCVILSTHIMDEVEKLCDRVAVIHEGRLRCCEPLTELRARVPSGRVEDAFTALVQS